jgi:transcriptional regulator with XRE-family HTH domain
MEFESLMPNVASTADAGRQPPEDNEEAVRIGRRLRWLRSERGMTILELAAKAGVSSGNVSQIERGASNPSINTLHKLRAALGVNLWAFLEDDKRQSVGESPYIRRSHDRPRIVAGTNQLTKELLSPRDNNELRFMILTVPPGAQGGEFLSGPGDKGGYVLSGKVELSIGDEVSELGVGDSFQFKSTIRHQVANRWAEEAKLIWIINIRESHL